MSPVLQETKSIFRAQGGSLESQHHPHSLQSGEQRTAEMEVIWVFGVVAHAPRQHLKSGEAQLPCCQMTLEMMLYRSRGKRTNSYTQGMYKCSVKTKGIGGSRPMTPRLPSNPFACGRGGQKDQCDRYGGLHLTVTSVLIASISSNHFLPCTLQ